MSETQATQPEVANYITDIFGADSDDEEQPVSKPIVTKVDDQQDDDALLEDSDDEAPTQKSNRLKKGGSNSQVASEPDEHVEDSDNDEVFKPQKDEKKRKKDGKSSGKIKKSRPNSVGSSSSKAATTDEKKERESGDEYDSGDDVVKTKEDERFIDEDDDFADVAAEYNAEEQNFDDERPDDYHKGKTKVKVSSGGEGSGSSYSKKGSDPFSETLEYMKKPKAVLMSEAEKDKITERLLHRMADACTKDEALFKKGEPPVYKLQMLKTVQQVVSVKTLQHNLLEKDILGAFKDWIEPKRDAAKTLASFSVRTAIYDMLDKLPCQTDHLKRTEGDKKPIGHTILALRKHKMETPENKRKLKEIMEKWCRPVFRKSADARSKTGDASATAELTALAMERHAAKAAAAAAEIATVKALIDGTEEDEGEGEGEDSQRERRGGVKESSQSQGTGFDAVLAGATHAKEKDIYLRARTPYSQGFLFTVQPDAKVVERKESNEKAFGQTRAALLKKMQQTGSKGKGVGTKLNPRAMDSSTTGRNKA
mmetsp:Transcript_12700/g.12339  ORF Transcript_12700/g.12339 Transcript_12700/m.12339 type:complete len:538 (-) Transcript_12700:175-1788(-)|eukprot:CAMPEP_0119042076 /NCGR_PEP_ID=MMETSP1177-20130426/14334_1 /TAXON_ID=2985 /ORGANISM="Ochromonas sp, Strain CCMP1899" /LENGTH=537 /DNA_ID=CAMNT_0007008599 /DNA_START=306 /DNA_END=1919 /DNA_ORIENTATION=+